MTPITKLAAVSALCAGALCAPAHAQDPSCRTMVFRASQATDGDSYASAVSNTRLVRQWLGGALSDTFTYTFTQIGSIPRPCAFDEAAWAKFRAKVRLDEYERRTKDIQAVGAAVLGQPPLVLSRGVTDGGAYVWNVEVQIVPWWETPTAHEADAARTVRLTLKKSVDERGDVSLRVTDVL